jgi:hypothetical protein
VTEGFVNLGLLYRTKAVADARALYCPGTALISQYWSYDYYTTLPDTWPSTPVGSGDDKVRAGYNYFPQLRTIEYIMGLILPEVTTTPGSANTLTPEKLTEVNPKKSIATDLVHNLNISPHRAQGSVAGLNALFPDGKVVFQNARTDPQAFDPALWSGIGNNGLNFRVVMNSWKP